MRRLTAVALLTLLLTTSASATEPIAPAATHGVKLTSTALNATSESNFDARSAGSQLPTIYMPYTPGQRIPDGWKLVTVKIPVKEVCTKTVCEELIVQVPREVSYMETKTIRFPTEVYKTYVRFKEIKVEDGMLKRHEDAPEADLDDLDLGDDDDIETVPVSVTAANQPAGGVQTVSAGGPGHFQPHAQQHSGPQHPARPGYVWAPVTKIRKRRVTIETPVKKIVEIDEGCWKEIEVQIPAPDCGTKHCPSPVAPPANEDGTAPAQPLPRGTVSVIRRVWQPNIVQREVTVMESREITIDETYTDYVEQPGVAPDIAPDIAPDTGPDLAPDTAPDIAPDVMVTTDRTVRIPQYVTKAERHYLTKKIQVPACKTVYEPVKKTVTREVPYEVVRMCERQILVPVDPRVIPRSLLADPLTPSGELLPPPAP